MEQQVWEVFTANLDSELPAIRPVRLALPAWEDILRKKHFLAWSVFSTPALDSAPQGAADELRGTCPGTCPPGTPRSSWTGGCCRSSAVRKSHSSEWRNDSGPCSILAWATLHRCFRTTSIFTGSVNGHTSLSGCLTKWNSLIVFRQETHLFLCTSHLDSGLANTRSVNQVARPHAKNRMHGAYDMDQTSTRRPSRRRFKRARVHRLDILAYF